MNAYWRRLFCTGVVLLVHGAVARPLTCQGALLEGLKMIANRSFKASDMGPEQGAGSSPVVVGPEVELPSFGSQLSPPLSATYSIDASDRTVLVTAIMDQPTNVQDGLSVVFFEDISDPPNFIRSVIVDPSSNWNGFTTNRAHGDGASVTFNFSGLSGQMGQFVLLHVIPEPASVALATTAALAGLAAARNRRRPRHDPLRTAKS